MRAPQKDVSSLTLFFKRQVECAAWALHGQSFGLCRNRSAATKPFWQQAIARIQKTSGAHTVGLPGCLAASSCMVHEDVHHDLKAQRHAKNQERRKSGAMATCGRFAPMQSKITDITAHEH